ncbi:hypothetical protein ACLOJK_001434 [Asimina triloba]
MDGLDQSLGIGELLDRTAESHLSILLNAQLRSGRSEMAEAKPGMRKPVFTKVDQLRPGTSGHTLTVKVVSSKMVLQKGRPDGPQVRQMRIAECLVGDETGMIVFTARNEQGGDNWIEMKPVKGQERPRIFASLAEEMNGIRDLTLCIGQRTGLGATLIGCENLMVQKVHFAIVEMMKPDTTVILRNAKIDMFKGSMRLAVDKWGRVEVTEPADFTVKEDNNLSLVEYELVNVVEEKKRSKSAVRIMKRSQIPCNAQVRQWNHCVWSDDSPTMVIAPDWQFL